MLTLRWHSGETRALRCKVCGAVGDGEVVADFDEPDGSRSTATRCSSCLSIDLMDQPSDFAPDDDAVDRYVEVGAGIALVTSRLSRLTSGPGLSSLEVGCNFGFGVDFAATQLRWSALGIEPSAAAERGARELGVEIVHELLTADTDLGRRFDLVIASEVIEHVTDPLGFLEAIRAHLVPGGSIYLTTPAAEAVTPSPDPTDALSAVSPGHHVFLCSKQGAELLLARAGFVSFEVLRDGDTLLLRASLDHELPILRDAVPHETIRDYLKSLAARGERASALRVGAAARWLRDAVAGQRWDEAHSASELFAEAFLARYDLDMKRPRAMVARLRRRGRPIWSLPGAAHAIAVLRDHDGGRRSDRATVEYLDLTFEALRLCSASPELFDRDLIDIWQAAADRRVKTAARFSSRRAASYADELVPPGVFADESERFDARLSRLTMDLLALGSGRTAIRLADRLEPSAQRAAESTDPGRAVDGRDGLYAVGIARTRAGDRRGAERALLACIAASEKAGDPAAALQGLARAALSEVARPAT